jgi:hypothetical protein
MPNRKRKTTQINYHSLLDSEDRIDLNINLEQER